MRVWERIKINDVVVYRDEKYIVVDIYKENSTTYGILKKVKDETMLHAMLASCRLDES